MPWMREDLAPTYAEKLGISKQELEQLKQNASQTDILFVDNMIHQYSRYFLNIPSEDKILTALYLVKHYDSATARKKLKEAGYTESYFLWADYGEIGHIQAAYDLAQQGISTAQQDEAYDQRVNTERTAFLSIMGGQLVNRLMTGPAFDAATGYSDQSMLDQLEKNGYLTAEQRKTIDSRFNQGNVIQGAPSSKDIAVEERENYTPPIGGGGITDSIFINGKTITFGHGGRHLEELGLNISKVNQAIAQDVSKIHPGINQFYKGQITVDFITIEYTSFGVSEEIINVGTYYPIP